MYDLNPPHVFVHERVHGNPRAVARMERLLAALDDPQVETVGTADMDRVIGLTRPPDDIGLINGRVRHGLEVTPSQPSFLFNTFVWDSAERGEYDAEKYPDAFSHSIARVMAGVGEDFAFSQRDPHFGDKEKWVCQGGWGIHSLKGCVHRCHYCNEGYCINFMLDLEDFAKHVSKMMQRRPDQKVYRYDLYSDSICFEPEHGASRVLAGCFARTEDKYLLFYTKSNNIEHLLELPDKSHCIFYCTLATETVCRDIEEGAPSMEERIEALRLCQEAGFLVRVGFSPIIPVRNWRQEATECLERLLAAVKPDTLRLWVLSLMGADELDQLIGLENLDPRMAESAQQVDATDRNSFELPFSVDDRVEIYGHYLDEVKRISADTPVSICSERRVVWERLAHKVTMSPDDLYCCCGGTSPPRRRGR